MAERSNTDILSEFFQKVTEGLRQEAAAKGQKFPIDKIRWEADEISGRYFGPSYVQYLFYGRGPGKQPPPDAMTAAVLSTPGALEMARAVYKSITAQQLGYLWGRKIAREGTDIYSGKKPGIDFLGVLEKSTPDLFQDLARNEAMKFLTDLKSVLDKEKVNA